VSVRYVFNGEPFGGISCATQFNSPVFSEVNTVAPQAAFASVNILSFLLGNVQGVLKRVYSVSATI
jgi:hypothetical protein